MSATSGSHVSPSSEQQAELPNRQTPFSDAFRAFIAEGWAPYSTELPERLPASIAAEERRRRVSERYRGVRLVVPAGGLKVRSNDTDYRFRPHSAFAHLTGLGTDREPDAVLILEPTDEGHDATLFFKPRAPRDSAEFYSDARYGEMWVGRRPSLDELSALCGLRCSAIEDLPSELGKNAAETVIRILREADAKLSEQVDELRDSNQAEENRAADAEFATALSELRLIKDDFEIEQMRAACARTVETFGEVVDALPEAVRRGRGERWIEGVFGLHARHVGNAVGYDSIVASGDHACTLHWIRNDGDLTEGDLLLLDAGIELDSLYTADITRTLPVNGRFTDAQREVYEAVLEAQQAGIEAARAGAKFADVHKAAISVIAHKLADWGMLPMSAEESLSEEGGLHRRWMVHGTSHHLGMDVHDCAQARVENYREGTLAPGMIITVEPGLYFKSDDELVPERFRGIGVRIEDDVLITEDGNELLSTGLPRTSAEVESWMAGR
jgi:Xaa-Pro aminopeptidase